MEKCRELHDYSIFVALVRDNQKSGLPLILAVNDAVEECIRNNVMADFLRKNRAEVLKVSLYEYDIVGNRIACPLMKRFMKRQPFSLFVFTVDSASPMHRTPQPSTRTVRPHGTVWQCIWRIMLSSNMLFVLSINIHSIISQNPLYFVNFAILITFSQ